ncbi:PAAR domain-containing protein [Zavarzinella formosa]|uniref:PAAR domain-containing protein n=1 Tax=Zavarzinella formosa TaxID=360055 RepID=UPI0003699751|nr:PAAR domain-containing protein [Zavarzinella formosa]
MPPAARLGDPTCHPGAIAGPGVPTVLIGGTPAAVVSDSHMCAFPPPAGPHPSNAIIKGSATVMIGGKPAARVGDPTGCGATIIAGMPSVLIAG